MAEHKKRAPVRSQCEISYKTIIHRIVIAVNMGRTMPWN